MTISAVNSVSFKGKAVTDQGNEYNTCNIGKYAGAGLGAAGTLYGAIKVKRGLPLLEQIVGIVEPILGDVITQFDSEATREGVAETFSNINFGKIMKKSCIVGSVVLGTLLTLCGLGLGTLVDGGINLFRAHKANKQTDETNKNKTDIQA